MDTSGIIANRKTATTTSSSTQATALAANSERAGFFIQNLGTNPLFVLLGSGATITNFNYILKGGTAANDGTGASIGQNVGVVYTGVITVAGTTPTYVATEQY